MVFKILVAFTLYIFCVLLKKSLPNPKPPRFSSKFYTSSFVVLSLTYRAMIQIIYFSLMVWGECWDLFFFCIFYSFIEWLSLTPVKNHLVPVARLKLCQFYHNLAPFYLSKEERREGRNSVACLLCARYRAKHFTCLFSFSSTTRLWVGILIIFWKRILASECLEGLSMVT